MTPYACHSGAGRTLSRRGVTPLVQRTARDQHAFRRRQCSPAATTPSMQLLTKD